MNHTAEKLLTFIKESPTAFQAVEMMKTRFTENGFTELKEDEHWEIKNGGKYHCIYRAGGFQRRVPYYCKPQ